MKTNHRNIPTAGLRHASRQAYYVSLAVTFVVFLFLGVMVYATCTDDASDTTSKSNWNCDNPQTEGAACSEIVYNDDLTCITYVANPRVKCIDYQQGGTNVTVSGSSTKYSGTCFDDGFGFWSCDASDIVSTNYAEPMPIKTTVDCVYGE